MMNSRAFVGVLMGTLIAGPSWAYSIWYVDPAGSGNYTAIQPAISSPLTLPGDHVVLADANYTGTGNHDIDFLGKAITVESQNGPAACVIDCQGNPSGFAFLGGEGHNSVLKGISIRNASVAGIICRSAPTVTQCKITNNAGRGIDEVGNAGDTIIISDCEILDNMGTGIFLFGQNFHVPISHTRISGNHDGGLVCISDGHANIDFCVITGNSSSQVGIGGGLTIDEGDLFISNTTISGNSAPRGGGVYVGSPGIVNFVQSILWGDCASVEGNEIDQPDQSGTNHLDCCDVDASGVVGDVVYGNGTFFQNPIFCGPESCTSAPTAGGDYTIAQTSLCAPAYSPCHQLIGALFPACIGEPTPTVTMTWGGIKAAYRGSGK